MIDPIQLIQDRHGKATKGPWSVAGPVGYIYADDPYGHGNMLVAQVRGWGHLTGTGACRFDDIKAASIQDANADFIAHAWEDIRTLLAEREALIAVLREVERHCPCGARPESLRTHPHVTGCPVGDALAAQPLPDETRETWWAVYDADGKQCAAYPQRHQADVYATGFSKPTTIRRLSAASARREEPQP